MRAGRDQYIGDSDDCSTLDRLWVVAGLIAGKLFHHTGNAALALDIGIVVVGAVAGGLAANSLGAMQPAAFVTFGLFGAAVGSIAALFGVPRDLPPRLKRGGPRTAP